MEKLSANHEIDQDQLKEFLDDKVVLYNNPKFIESDPIQIPHQFSSKEDIEISGFLTATIAWGNRKSIINNASKMTYFFRMKELNGNNEFDPYRKEPRYTAFLKKHYLPTTN